MHELFSFLIKKTIKPVPTEDCGLRYQVFQGESTAKFQCDDCGYCKYDRTPRPGYPPLRHHIDSNNLSTLIEVSDPDGDYKLEVCDRGNRIISRREVVESGNLKDLERR